MDDSRYSRQTCLKQFAKTGQQALTNSTVLIVGVGGLGCQLASLLTGSGVGELLLLDHDKVELSNLHRQPLYKEAHIGLYKAEVAAQQLHLLNSQVSISAYCEKLHCDNAQNLIRQADLVIDAADNFAVSYLLSDACQALNKPLLSASVSKTFGYIGLFCGTVDQPSPSFRALFPQLGKHPIDCNSAGVTAASVAIVSGYQAQEALKILLKDKQQLHGELLYLDLWDYRQHRIDFSSAAEPKASNIALIGPNNTTKKDLYIDVREQTEVKQQPLTLAPLLHISLTELMRKPAKQLLAEPSFQRLVCVCHSGQRALIAAHHLQTQGYQNLAVYLTP